ncbi:MAG TPA: hypothetical protein VMX57_07040 [Planctomycetota bacterium]|nr:hypothetical protein [Planctomycetota bacterium]
MKHSPDIQRVIDRMKPGVLSLHGFLGSDRRELEEILDTDASTVTGLGTTHRALADALRRALEKARDAFGSTARVDDRLTARLLEVKGRIPCPWGDGSFAKGEVVLTDVPTGERMCFTPLSVHLVAKHGFYNGRGSRWRVEPADVLRLFRLTRGERDVE